jgi:hypothetical protein
MEMVAGANNTLKMPVLKTDKAKKQISISSASGECIY